MKYPRTYNLPYSPGITKDDKILQNEWFNNYIGKEIVITEKLDGSTLYITNKDCYHKYSDEPTRAPWNQNIWDPKNGLHLKIKDFIKDNETIYGENLYKEHRIHYNKLTDYFHLFAINDGINWYSWDNVKEFANNIHIPHVPELWRGILYNENELKNLIDNYISTPSLYGDTKEGVVIRLTNSFPIEDFSKYVCKWVRI